MVRVLGYAPDELTGSNALALVHPLDLDSVKRQFDELLREPSRIAAAEIRCKGKDDTWRWIEGVGKKLLEDAAVGAIVVISAISLTVGLPMKCYGNCRYELSTLRNRNGGVSARPARQRQSNSFVREIQNRER